jgi:hypothetical protein
MGQARNDYDDLSDLIADSLAVLAQRRAKYDGDDIAAVALLAELVDAAESALASRVRAARVTGHSWQDISRALNTSPIEVRLRFDHRAVGDRAWLHEQ